VGWIAIAISGVALLWTIVWSIRTGRRDAAQNRIIEELQAQQAKTERQVTDSAEPDPVERAEQQGGVLSATAQHHNGNIYVLRVVNHGPGPVVVRAVEPIGEPKPGWHRTFDQAEPRELDANEHLDAALIPLSFGGQRATNVRLRWTDARQDQSWERDCPLDY
jgi:hypothetical protein